MSTIMSDDELFDFDWPDDGRTWLTRLMNRSMEAGVCLLALWYSALVWIDMFLLPPDPHDAWFLGPIIERVRPGWGAPMALSWTAGAVLWQLANLRWFDDMKRYWWLRRVGILLFILGWAGYGWQCWFHPAGHYMGGLGVATCLILGALGRLNATVMHEHRVWKIRNEANAMRGASTISNRVSGAA